jgi:hypothetical protein
MQTKFSIEGNKSSALMSADILYILLILKILEKTNLQLG